MLLSIFTFGTLWFWLLIAAAGAGVFWQLDRNPVAGPITVILGTLALLVLFSDIPVITWILQNPYIVVASVLGYLAIGALYSMLQWYFYVTDHARNYAERRKEIQDRYNTSYKNTYATFMEYCTAHGIIPLPSNNKARLTAWAMYWPVSMIWTLTHDIVYRTFRWMYERMYGIYYSISFGVFTKKFSEFK